LQRQRAGFPRFEFAYRIHPTGGLRPPRSCCRANVCRRKTIFAMHERTFTRAAGVSPPWYVSNAITIADAFVQRPALARRWSETRVATATRWISAFRDRIPSTSHGGLTPPALGSRCTVGEQMAIFAMHERTFTRAAGVSPPWVLGKRTCKSASAKSRETAGSVLTDAGAVAVANRRGAYAPRSCVRVRMSAGEKTIFAMHERTFTGAAGVSPPWV
jgi:hypothetical protein